MSQQAYSRAFAKPIISAASNQAEAYLAKGANWAMSAIMPKVTGEVQKRGDTITNAVNDAVNQQKQNISDGVVKKIGNYFSGVANSITQPGTPQDCQPAATSSGQ